MGAAVIGLTGALLGVVITLLGGALAERRQARREAERWRRDQRVAAYDGALRHLLRAANMRSEFLGGDGAAVLRPEHQREWFEDLVQAQFWLQVVTRYCGRDQLDEVRRIASRLDGAVAALTSGQRYTEKGFSIRDVLTECVRRLSDAARADLGDGAQPPSTAPGARRDGQADDEPRRVGRNIIMGPVAGSIRIGPATPDIIDVPGQPFRPAGRGDEPSDEG